MYEVCNLRIPLNYKILISSLTSLRAKMAQQGKQMRVGAREGFAYHSVKLVSLAKCRYGGDSNTFF